MNIEIELPIGHPKFPGLVIILDCAERDELIVPRFTRDNISKLIQWLWGFDPSLTCEDDPDAPTETYLLDDLMQLLGGGIFSVMYPTDYGKSTLVDADTVLSLLLWPEDSLNIIIKKTKDAAAESAAACYWKLRMAAEYFPYAKPLARVNPGNSKPEVKNGFFIMGSRLRQFGSRDFSIYPAGIGDGSVQGKRGRTKIDDVEDQNTMKSPAKVDTLHKQINNSVRNYEDTGRGVWAVFGTPQGSNSIMYAVDAEMSSIGKKFCVIRRPEVIQEGPNAGRLLWPKRKLKSEIQRRLMDPAAHRIAYSLLPPGAGRFNGADVIDTIRDRDLPRMANIRQWREYIFARCYQDYYKQIGFAAELRSEQDLYGYCRRLVDEEMSLYIGWDPATTGTFALHLLAMLPESRWILRSLIDSGAADQQAEVVSSWYQLFGPDLTVVIENNGQQASFITVLQMINPDVPWAPHTTTAERRDSGPIAIPSMMSEMGKPGWWHLPYDDPEECDDEFGGILTEIRRWGPSGHPHGIPSLWFPWYFDMRAGRYVPPSSEEVADHQVHDVISPGVSPIQQSRETAVDRKAMEAWNPSWRKP